MRNIFSYILLIYALNYNAQPPNWTAIKDTTTPFIAIPTEFDTAYRLPHTVGGWEDSDFITRDGLTLYCLYAPIDAFSWLYGGGGQLNSFSQYARGPDFGMDLITNPGNYSEWMQFDILIAQRSSIQQDFMSWELSNLATPIFGEGGPHVIQKTDGSVDIFSYTTNNTPNYSLDIFVFRDTSLNPSGIGTPLPSPINTDSTKEDNPHIERINDTTLVLFFECPDCADSTGGWDIYYSISHDDGLSWDIPNNVSSINTILNEGMPHLYKDQSGDWWIYFAATNPADQRLSIYRCKNQINGDWNSWINKELVIGVGNAFALGEPSLTNNGDLYFGVVYSAGINCSQTDCYDMDTWILRNINSPISSDQNIINDIKTIVKIYPNPVNNILYISSTYKIKWISILNAYGQKLINKEKLANNHQFDMSRFSNGLYLILIETENGMVSKILIKK